MVTHDALTGLPNWRNFEHQFLNTITIHKDQQHAVLFIDLDGFKNVNDNHGHKVGDHVLIETAQRLKKAINNSGVVARIGGDEFVVYMPCIDNNEIIETVCQEIICAINLPFVQQNPPINISSSIGIALFPNHATNLDDLTSLADTAMYEAKNAGKSRYRFFTI